MASGRMILRLGLAALVSGASAGMLIPVMVFLGGLALGGWTADWDSFAMLVEWLGFGFLVGLILAALPAFLAGASMWALGRNFESARRPVPWAAAGAVVAGALWALAQLVSGGFGNLDFFETSLLAASLPAGAGGALAFLAAMRLSGRLCGEARRERI